MPHYIITGGAGFVGSLLAEELLKTKDVSLSLVDNLDGFYDPGLKQQNLINLKNKIQFWPIDITNQAALQPVFEDRPIDAIIHLAAKAGVRPSILQPQAYYEVNVTGTQNLLELAKKYHIGQFVFASSSSVYGVNENTPWRESDSLLKPISPYASSKLACEQMGHVYSHLYGIRFLALRFFTVYGPRQRPDLMIHKVIRAIEQDTPIPMYGDGTTLRDYTYVGDIVQGVVKALRYDTSMYEIFNIGNNRVVSLTELIKEIETLMRATARIDRLPPVPGDVPVTRADISKAQTLLGYSPLTDLTTGLQAQIKWQTTLSSLQHG